jgi:hypothetical protein
LWSLLIFAGFLTVAWVTNSLAWPLLIPAVALFLVGSFLWAVTVPGLLFAGLVVVLILLERPV